MKKTAVLFIVLFQLNIANGMEKKKIPIEVSIINSSQTPVFIRQTNHKFERLRPNYRELLYVKEGEKVTIFKSEKTSKFGTPKLTNLLGRQKVPSFKAPKEIVIINADLSVDINNVD